MGGQVAAAVRNGRDGAAEPVRGQRPVGVRARGALGAGVRVVHRERHALAKRGHHAGPGLVPRPADLGALARLGRRPPAVQPAPVGGVEIRAQPLPAVARVDLQEADAACGIDLGEGARHGVEPLVGDEQPGDVVGHAVGPRHGGVEALGAAADLDGGERDPRAELRREGGSQGQQQLGAARAHVDDVQPRRPAEVGVDLHGDLREGAAEQRRGVRGGAEVVGRRLAAVEAGRPVQRLGPRLLPGLPGGDGVVGAGALHGRRP